MKATSPEAIACLFLPKSVAIVGASADPSKTSGRPIAYLKRHGYTGTIYPINPRVSQIDGLASYSELSALPEVPEVAMVLLGAEASIDSVRQLAQIGTKVAIVLASGFSETGAAGAARQHALLEAAGNMRLLGPNTIGLVNLSQRMVLSASSALETDHLLLGGLSVISQSGGILGSLLSRASAQGIGLSKLVSTSNEVDLDLADFVDFLADDPATQVIALYVESIRHPERFRLAALKAAACGKPIVAFKVGRSEAGALAAASHTGAMAGADRLYEAFFRQLGVLRAQRFSDLLDMPSALLTGRSLNGLRVAILTSTGGAGTLVSDALGIDGFETPAPDEATAQRLRALQTGDEAVLDRNPIDVTLAGLKPTLLRGAISALLDSPSYDALVVIAGSSALAMPELMADAIHTCLPSSDKPVIAYVSPHAPNVAKLLTERGVPAFTAPEACSVALSAMRHAKNLTSVAEPSLVSPDDSTTSKAVQAVLGKLPAGPLDEAQAKQLFAAFGIPCVHETVVTNASEAMAAAQHFGAQVVLKLLSKDVTHKSELGGVAIGVSPSQLVERLAQMRVEVGRKLGVAPERFLVQEMIFGGVELILGAHQDPLGTALMLGMGGVTAELFNDTCFHLLTPGHEISRTEIVSMLRQLKTWPLLNEYRGRPAVDLDALIEAVISFSKMLVQLGDQLLQAEINPLFVLPKGRGVRAADGVVQLAATKPLVLRR